MSPSGPYFGCIYDLGDETFRLISSVPKVSAAMATRQPFRDHGSDINQYPLDQLWYGRLPPPTPLDVGLDGENMDLADDFDDRHGLKDFQGKSGISSAAAEGTAPGDQQINDNTSQSGTQSRSEA